MTEVELTKEEKHDDMDRILNIKRKIEKSATTFEVGGFRPANTIEESWIGRVFAYGEGEEIPKDDEGKLMVPLIQFYLPNLPFVPEQLQGRKLLTVFMAEGYPEIFAKNGEGFVIREYGLEDNIVTKELNNPDSLIRPFPLKPALVTDDCPEWDGGGLDWETSDEIIALEKSGAIESYYDISTQHYETKLGGYPSFCQSGVDFGERFEFVFQIASEPKANLSILDSGSFLFARHRDTGGWKIYYDSY